MKINTMEIQRQVFKKSFRGYDRDEVRTYLGFIAEEAAALQKERDIFEREVATLRGLVEDFRNRETILKNTLLTAQRLTEEMKDNARKQAEGIVKEAELRADRLLELARERAGDIDKTILDLRSQRQALRSDIRALISRVAHLIDLQEEAELEDNLHFLVRREQQA
ncbi:MAG: DivIVA domain-containing protein [Vicinamibacteria bacterium]|nr:DivIVA domain-containing protein [Vicinamibacteria bacterium]